MCNPITLSFPMGYCCNWGLVYRHPVTCIKNLSSQVFLCMWGTELSQLCNESSTHVATFASHILCTVLYDKRVAVSFVAAADAQLYTCKNRGVDAECVFWSWNNVQEQQ